MTIFHIIATFHAQPNLTPMRSLFLLTSILLPSILLSQDINPKYGKVSKEELLLTECPFYPEANAMILSEVGKLNFRYNDPKKQWQYVMEVTRRIKVFNITGKDQGNVAIRVYNPVDAQSKEVISGIKGYTYNLVDGKIIKVKLKNSEEFTTRLNDYRVEKVFTMPDVQEGSVFEYKYTLTSDYISTLSTWNFQKDIPTGFSDFKFTIPEYFIYNISQVGSYVKLERSDANVNEDFTYSWESLPTPGGGTERGRSTISSLSKSQTITGRNILPLQDEPYMNNKPNIPARIEFQLMTINMPHSTPKMLAGNYEEFNKNILSWSGFGGRLNKGNFAKEQVDALQHESASKKALTIYHWLRSHFTWNEVYGVTSEVAGRNAYNQATGSAADINLSLVAAYRKAGLEANPVLISTRGHGIPHPIYPNYEDFNYVIAGVQIDGTTYLTDATSNRPFGELPLRCLNGKGWMASENGGKWVNLKSNALHKVKLFTQMRFEGEILKANITAKYENHAASNERGRYKQAGESTYQASLSEQFPEWQLNEFIINDTSSLFNMEFDVEKSFDGEDLIYIQPILFGGITENDFKREERFSPVDFPYAIQKTIIVAIELPEGYQPELPKPVHIRLPDNGGKLIYQVSQVGNSINVMCNITLDKLDFTPDEYPYIRSFYQAIVDTNNEMIVLKKI